MTYEPTLQVLYISRVRFFEIAAKFPDLRDKIIEAGETFIRGRLTKEDTEKILEAFPGSVWE
jgi:hypothetical protein